MRSKQGQANFIAVKLGSHQSRDYARMFQSLLYIRDLHYFAHADRRPRLRVVEESQEFCAATTTGLYSNNSSAGAGYLWT